MGCPCKQQSNDAKSYAKVKEIAAKYGKSYGVTVVIYRITGGFAFMDATCKEAEGVAGVEYLYPM